MTKYTPEQRKAASEWLSKAEFLIGEATRSLQQNNTTAYRQLLLAAFTALQRGTAATSADDTAAIAAIFTDAVKAEEAGERGEPNGILATIHGVYEEFKPETMKGFDVNIDGRTERFDHLNDAEFYARCNADRVARASSVDHYLYDKNFGAASVKAEDATKQKADSILPTAVPVSHTRWHEHDGKLFLIRDTFDGLRLQCQYGVKGEGTAVEDFAEIEPFIG